MKLPTYVTTLPLQNLIHIGYSAWTDYLKYGIAE